MQILTRRLALLVSSGTLLTQQPRRASADPLSVRVQGSAAILDKLSARWSELTVQCTYAEADRSMMQNKTLLLEKASVKGAYQKDSSVVVNTCKVDASAVRPLIAKDSAIARLPSQLTKEGLDQVDPDDFERFVALVEQFDRALGEASAAMYLSGTGDFNAKTGFAVGEVPVAPNLDAAKDRIDEARSLLASLRRLLPIDG